MILLLAYACICNFKLSQIDMKSVFLNGFLNEKVYMYHNLLALKITSILIMFSN